MSIHQRLNEIEVAIAQHRQEWAGMLGTVWEREDWQRKQRARGELLRALGGAVA